MTVPRWLPVAAVTVLAAGVAWLNRGERVAVDLGIATFYRAPLTVVLFAAFLAGMLSMLALSLRQDLRLRDELRRRGLLDAPAARIEVTEWERPRETAAEPEPEPEREEEDDRTIAYPRYDGDPAD